MSTNVLIWSAWELTAGQEIFCFMQVHMCAHKCTSKWSFFFFFPFFDETFSHSGKTILLFFFLVSGFIISAGKDTHFSD